MADPSPPVFRIVIPARFASQRLPGKPLRDINGKPMIEWVWQAAMQAGAADVVVATDDERIAETVTGFGGQACMTSSDHQSGTDRILEVARINAWSDDQIVVNLQGDEPLMPAENMTQVARILADHGCDMATLHKPVGADQIDDPGLVKLVHDQQGRALYFSRSPIPFDRGGTNPVYCGHVGIYAYRVGFIETFSRLDRSALEAAESLEQLRALDHGYVIHTEIANATPGPGIDTEADLEYVSTLLG